MGKELLAAAKEGTMHRVTKTMLLLALGLAVVASAIPGSFAGATSSIGVRPEKAVTIPLYGSATSVAGWGRGPNNITEPGPTLTVQQGDVITFQLYSNDSMPHQLIIDLDNSHSNTSGDGWSYEFSSPTTPMAFTYTANTAGTFAYFCNLHGYNVQHGTLEVNAASSSPPADNTLLIVGGVIAVVVVIAGGTAAMRMRKKQPPQQPPQP
jgi:plastocyanin